ncbi:hypothetical protein ACPEIC_46080 [Stenotrophomonas sp. NPDC087984]
MSASGWPRCWRGRQRNTGTHGSLPSEHTWQRDVATTGDVILTGPMADVDCIDPAIHAGLTTYVRVPLSIER